MKKLISLLLAFSIIGVNPAMAEDEDDIIKNTQNDIMIVAGTGAAGAVLGLSTLSFVDKPSKHVANIWTGAAIGVIVGVIFVAYSSAQKNQEDMQSSSEFHTLERVTWHQENTEILSLPAVQFGTQIWQASF